MPALRAPALVLPKPIPDFELPPSQDEPDGQPSVIVTKLESSHLSAASEFTGPKANWILLWAPDVSSKQAALFEIAFQALSGKSKSRRAKIWVFADKKVPNRILNAFKDEVAESTIADAKVEDGTLEVLTCAFEVIRIDHAKAMALAKVPVEELGGFEVDPWGNYLCWPKFNIDLDVHSLRFEADAEYQAQYLNQVARSSRRMGEALKRMREEAGIRQTGFPSLTDREIRRIEGGEVSVKVATFKKLAEGFRLDIAPFLEKLSKFLADLPRESVT